LVIFPKMTEQAPAKVRKIEMSKPWMPRPDAEHLIRRLKTGEISDVEIAETLETVKLAITNSKKLPSYFENVTPEVTVTKENAKFTRTVGFTAANGAVVRDDILLPPVWLHRKSESNFKVAADRYPKTDPVSSGNQLIGCLVNFVDSLDEMTQLLAPEHSKFFSFITDLQDQLISKDATGVARTEFDKPRPPPVRGQVDGAIRGDQPTIRRPMDETKYPALFTVRSSHASKAQIPDPTKPAPMFGVSPKEALQRCLDYFSDEYNHGFEAPPATDGAATASTEKRTDWKEEITIKNASVIKAGKKSGQQFITYPTEIPWMDKNRMLIPVPVVDAIFGHAEGVVVSMHVRLAAINATNIALYLTGVTVLGFRNKTDGWTQHENAFIF
jgi:hypothetical protein